MILQKVICNSCVNKKAAFNLNTWRRKFQCKYKPPARIFIHMSCLKYGWKGMTILHPPKTNLSPQKNQKDIKSILGLTNYYKKFVAGYSKICAPLFNLLKKNVTFAWTQECQKSLDTLKGLMPSAPIVAFPDMNRSFWF